MPGDRIPNRPGPTVELIEFDAADRPFHSPARWTGAPASELDRYGYRVDEYLVGGSAHWYAHSPKTGGAIIDPAQPELVEYRTRACVVRPRDAAAFSGNVLVEGFNPSLGHDLSMLWSDVGGLQMADGDVFVGFTYKASAAQVLAAADPRRYSTIVVPNDRVQWDLIRDVLALSRGAGEATLLGDLTVAANVIMTGGSQASGLLQALIAEGLHEPAGAVREFPTADFDPPAAHHESAFIISAMLDGMRRWRNEGVPMAKVPRLEYDAAPVVRRDGIGRFTTGLRFQTDELGHATGGVRYPTIDAPVDIFWEVPSGAFPADWMREPMPGEWIEKRYRSAERWLAIATGSLDRAIELGTVRPDHRSRFIDFMRDHVARR